MTKLYDMCINMNTCNTTKAQLNSYMKTILNNVEDEGVVARIEEIKFCMTIGRMSKEEKDTISMELYEIASSVVNN